MLVDTRSGNGSGGFCGLIPDLIVGIEAVGPGTERRRGRRWQLGAMGPEEATQSRLTGASAVSVPAGAG